MAKPIMDSILNAALIALVATSPWVILPLIMDVSTFARRLPAALTSLMYQVAQALAT